MPKHPSWLAIGTSLVLLPLAAHGMGFGELRGSALLNRPLSFAARVTLGPDEVLEPGCVKAEVLSGDEKLGPDQIKVSFPQGLASGDRTVFVTTTRRMDEPVVTVTVTLGCASRVSRKFVLFLDPPTVNLASRGDGSGTAEASRAQASDSAVQAAVSQPSAPPPGRSPRSERTALPGGSSSAVASESPARNEGPAPAVQRPSRTKPRAVARSSGGGPRLHVDAMPTANSRSRVPADPKMERPSRIASNTDQAAAPSAPASASAVAPGTASELDLLRAELERERQRSRALESTLAELQKQQGRTQQSIADLQSRAASAGREGDVRMVYALAAFCGVLVLLLLVMLWRAPRGSSRRWWDASRQAPMTDIGPETAPRIDSRLPTADPPWLREMPAAGSSARAMKPSAADSVIGGLEVTAVPDHALLFSMREEESKPNGGVTAPAMSSAAKSPEPFESPFTLKRNAITLDLDLSSTTPQPSMPRRPV